MVEPVSSCLQSGCEASGGASRTSSSGAGAVGVLMTSSSSWNVSAPVMAATTSSIDTSLGFRRATRVPSRMTSIRSATSNTSGMLWLMSTTERPCSRTRWTCSSTLRVCTTPSAAVGSSMNTTRFAHVTARQIAMPWRWPPDMFATRALVSWIFTPRPLNASSLLRRIVDLSRNPSLPSSPGRSNSRPRNMFAAGSISAASARSWKTVSIPRSRASCGVAMSTGLPSKRICAAVGGMHADQRLDERALAGPVVAHQRDDLLRVDGEVRAAQRLHAPERLHDSPGLQNRFRRHDPRLSAVRLGAGRRLRLAVRLRARGHGPRRAGLTLALHLSSHAGAARRRSTLVPPSSARKLPSRCDVIAG